MVDTAVNSRTALRRRITDEIVAFFEEQRTGADAETLPLTDELEAIVQAGGKRVRPVFCYWGHRAAGGVDSVEVIRAAAALELLHTFAIVHDDVMDRSPMRRGRYASHRALEEMATFHSHRGDPERFGVSAAILAGDLALVLADRLLDESGFPADVVKRTRVRYDRMRMRAIAGQYLDLLAAHRGDIDERGARRIGELKSAGYTVADPLVIGALLAAPEGPVHANLEAFGRPLGEAFQMRDDVLSVFGDPAITGKDRDGDLREGKQTVLIAKARRFASPEGRATLQRHLGNSNLDPDEAAEIRNVILESGALDATLQDIARLTIRAKNALDSSLVGTECAAALSALADEVAARES